MKKFTISVLIHLADTDATGVIFFPKLFEKCLFILEMFLKKHFGKHLIHNQNFIFPVVEAKGNYFSPVRLFDELVCEMTAEKIGTTSVKLLYQFFDQEKKCVMSAAIVHVCARMDTKEKEPLPKAWQDLFQQIRL